MVLSRRCSIAEADGDRRWALGSARSGRAARTVSARDSALPERVLHAREREELAAEACIDEEVGHEEDIAARFQPSDHDAGHLITVRRRRDGPVSMERDEAPVEPIRRDHLVQDRHRDPRIAAQALTLPLPG